MTVTIVAGISAWISDAAYDAYIAHKGPFWVILTDAYSHEPFLRLFLVAGFLVFGITLSVILAKRNKLSERMPGEFDGHRVVHGRDRDLRS